MLDGWILWGVNIDRPTALATHSQLYRAPWRRTPARLARVLCQLARPVPAKLLHLVAAVTAVVSDELQQPIEPQERPRGMCLDRAPRAPAPAVTVPRH